MANKIFDVRGSGDLKSLMNMFAISLDELKSWIEQLSDVLTIDYTKEIHLPIISALLGYPVSQGDDPEFVRRQLKTAIDWYKTKGTMESFRILLYNLGLDVEIIPLWTADYCGEPLANASQYLGIVLPENITYALNTTPVLVTNPDGQSDSVTNQPGLCI